MAWSLDLTGAEDLNPDVSSDTPADDEGGPYAAVGPDEEGRTIVLGLGTDRAEVLRDAEEWGDDGMEVDGVHRIDRALASHIEAHGGQDTVVAVREDGVVDLAPGCAVATPAPSPYPMTFPMQRRLRDAGLHSLDALVADVEARGGPEGWLDYAIANYEGVGRSHGRRVVDALPAPAVVASGDGQDGDVVPAGQGFDFSKPAQRAEVEA